MAPVENMGEQLGSVVNEVEVPTAEAQTIEDAKAWLTIPRMSAVNRNSDRLSTAVFSP
jgi:hypothetical protein